MTITEMFLIYVDSDRACHEHCMGDAEHVLATASEAEEVIDGIWTVEQAMKFILARNLKDWCELMIDDIAGHYESNDSKGGLVLTLCHCGFEEMDWSEVAEHYLGKVAEGCQP